MKFLRPLLHIVAAIAMIAAPIGVIWLFCIFAESYPIIGSIIFVVGLNLLAYFLCYVLRRCRRSLFWITFGLTVFASIALFFGWLRSF